MQLRLQPDSTGLRAGTFLAALLLSTVALFASPAQAAQSNTPVGMNLGGISYWQNTMPFTNAMKNAGTWLSTDSSGAWDTNLAGQIPLDADGYPLQLPATINGSQVYVHSLVLGNKHAAGKFVLLYDGDGDLQVSGPSITNRSAGRLELNVNADQQIILAISRSSASNHVRNIRLVNAQAEATYQNQTIDPGFLARLNGVSVVRFMDWNLTYSSNIVRWQDRTTPSYYTQSTSTGVAIEYQIDVVNALQADYWMNLPVTVEDDYVRQAAKLVHQRLAQGSKVYIELGNEIWNGGSFGAQQSYVQNKGCALGLNSLGNYTGDCSSSGPRYWAGLKWQARRSAEIFRMFEQEFGGASRLVRVIASQAGYTDIGRNLLQAYKDPSITPQQGGVDALAIAPYFGGGLADKIDSNGETNSISVDEIVNRLDNSIDTDTAVMTRENKATADANGVALIAYEGGQHLVAYNAANNSALTKKLNDTNRNQRMRTLYNRMFDVWTSNGGGRFAFFTHIEGFSKYGSWGVLEYQDQPTEQAPKFQGVLDIMARTGGTAPPPPPPPPVTLPAAPTALSATVQANAIRISWAAGSNDQQGFHVQRSSDGSNFSALADTNATTTAYVDATAAVGLTYTYRVQAYNSNGVSSYSSTVTAKLSAPTAAVPTAPASLTASGRRSSIALQWTDRANNETGYYVERSVSGGAFTQIGQLGANTATFVDSNVSGWRRYTYRVRAYNSAGNSAYSNSVTAQSRWF